MENTTLVFKRFGFRQTFFKWINHKNKVFTVQLSCMNYQVQSATSLLLWSSDICTIMAFSRVDFMRPDQEKNTILTIIHLRLAQKITKMWQLRSGLHFAPISRGKKGTWYCYWAFKYHHHLPQRKWVFPLTSTWIWHVMLCAPHVLVKPLLFH